MLYEQLNNVDQCRGDFLTTREKIATVLLALFLPVESIMHSYKNTGKCKYIV